MRPRLVGASLLKFLEGFVFVSGMNALNINLLKAHWHQWSIEAMPTYTYTQTFLIICSKHCFASRLGGEASLLTHLLRHQNWRATGVMKVIPVSSTTINLSILTRIAPAPTAPAKTGCIGLICPAGVIGARVCAVGVCSSGAQCQGDEDDEASEKTDWRHGNCQHRAK